jgi:hypothetical protein
MTRNDSTDESEPDLQAQEPWEKTNLVREICEQMLSLTKQVAGTIRRRVRGVRESSSTQDPQLNADSPFSTRPTISDEQDDTGDHPCPKECA